MNRFIPSRQNLRAAYVTVVATIIAGCTTTPLPTQPPTPTLPAPAQSPYTEPATPAASSSEAPMSSISAATNPRDYRQDAAKHLYGQNSHRIFRGKMPPLLYAIGVLQVEVDGRGQVTAVSWMRAPSHAPEVVAEIERTVRRAAPYPVPVRMGRVTYTDTWLWHKSGNFQLDTLTEGQM